MDVLRALLLAMAEVTVALAPWLLLGAVVAGLLHVLLPSGFVRRHLGGRGGVLKAVALGVPLPLCSCGVIPAGLGLRRDGASAGASVGFLISTPQTGVDSTLVAASMLGWPLALLKLGAAAVTGVIGGWLADAVGVEQQAAAVEPSRAEAQVDRSVRGAIEHSLEVLRTIWHWLVIGVVVSAVITVLVPPQVFSVLTGPGEIFALLSVLLLSLPLYVCATASVPIAAALVAGGFPPGAALVFLMAGPATNVATLGAVYRTLGRRALAVYLSTVVVGSLAAALLFDSVLGSAAVAAAGYHEHTSWVAIAMAVGLTGLLAWFAASDLRGWWIARRSRAAVGGAGQVELCLAVEGMTCGGCANRLRTALLASGRVAQAEVDHQAGQARIVGSLDEDAARDIVQQTGFRPV